MKRINWRNWFALLVYSWAAAYLAFIIAARLLTSD